MIGFDAFNSVTLVGRLSKDIETRYTQSGKAIGNTSMAVKEYNRETQKNDGVMWVNLVCFDEKTVENSGKFMKKGDLVLVTGELSMRKWKGNDDVERSSLEVRIFTIVKLGKSPEGNGGGSGNGSNNGPREVPVAAAPPRRDNTGFAEAEIDEDSVPF